MGFLRTLLALSVAIDHFGGLFGFHMGPGAVEVEAFFIISGFYMAMVLEQRYRDRLALFYSNRYLRLFPSYAAVLLLTVLFVALTGDGLRLPREALLAWFTSGDLLFKLYVLFANASIFSLDTALFMWFDGTSLHFGDFHQGVVPVFHFLLIPQGWSLGVELLFYIVAPFLTRSAWRVALAFAASLALSISLRAAGRPADPWTHRFMPTVLYIFLLGAIAWRVSAPRLDAAWFKRLGVVSLAVLAVFVLGYAAWPFVPEVKRIICLTLTALGVGPIFALTKNTRADSLLGEASYPIYISHNLAKAGAMAFLPASAIAPAALAVTILLSLGLLLIVERPLDRWRSARVTRRNPQTNPAALSV